MSAFQMFAFLWGIWKFYKGSILHISCLQRVDYKGALLFQVLLNLNNPTSSGILN